MEDEVLEENRQLPALDWPDDNRIRRGLDNGQCEVLMMVMSEEHKRRIAEGRARYHAERKGEKQMPFMKRRMEDDEPPQERVERTDRIVREARGTQREEPEYTETSEMVEEEQEPPRKAPQKPSALTVKYSLEEMHLDRQAHLAVITATQDSLLRTGMPAHLAAVTMQSICSGHIQRVKDIEQVLKQYGN